MVKIVGPTSDHATELSGRMSLDAVVWTSADRLHGEPCFINTRVPVRALFDHLRAGDTIERFLEGYDGVTREQCVAVIEMAGQAWLTGLRKS